MRRLAFLAIVFLLSPISPVFADNTVERMTLKGAPGLIVLPEGWDPATGSLVIYAHGYSADRRLLDDPFADLTKLDTLFLPSQLVLAPGRAVATTAFRSVGWYVKDAIKDIENLRRYFVKRYGKPKRTYLWGHSGGGMVTAAVIEALPTVYDAAAPLCGPVAGGRRNFNAAYDLRVVYEYVCGDVPGAQFTCRVCSGGRARCLQEGDCPAGETCGAFESPVSPNEGLSKSCTEFLLEHPDRFSENPTSPGGGFVDGPATECFGDLSGATPPSEAQARRRDLFLRATQIPDDFIATDLFFASIGMAEVVHRRTGGKPPWGNVDVDYAPPALSADERAALNAGVHRSAGHPDAVRYMRRYFEPRGRTKSKVLTVHALDDGLVIPENETKYRQIFDAAGTGDQLVQLQTTRGGHCGFIGELFQVIPALERWVEQGEKPTMDGIASRCGGGCDLTATAPGPWGLRSPERRQKGAPLTTYACSGLAGDCPAGTTCDVPAGHCRK